MRILIAVLVVLLLALQYRLWIADDGIRDTVRLHRALQEQTEANRRLEERNAALAAEVEDLRSGLAAIEERARAELGMIREGETFFQVVEDRAADGEEREDE